MNGVQSSVVKIEIKKQIQEMKFLLSKNKRINFYIKYENDDRVL